MGNGADKIIKVLSSLDIPVSGIFSSDGFVRKKSFHGMPLCSYSELEEKLGDMIVLLCFGSQLPEVIGNIKRISSLQELYAPDVPVYGGTLFNAEYVNENLEDLRRIHSLLADDISKKTFENTVRYKLSGDINYLFDCEVSPDEPYQSFLKLTDNEIFADLGAYRGDTVADFSPLGELTVREVLMIGDDLGLPYDLVHKTPSDGMSGKSDEEKIGFTYDELDNYILYVDDNLSDETIAKIEKMHKANEHKLNDIPRFVPMGRSEWI
jgi:hypothetical protein